jgi:hypothetical protein
LFYYGVMNITPYTLPICADVVDPQVQHKGQEIYKERPVERYLCVSCGKCALVNASALGTELFEQELRETSLCNLAADSIIREQGSALQRGITITADVVQ